MRPVQNTLEPHYETIESGISHRHDPVEIGMDVIGLAFAQQQSRGGAAEARQRLGAEPGISREGLPGRGIDVRPHEPSRTPLVIATEAAPTLLD